MTIKMCRNVIRLLEVHIEHTAIAKSRIVHSPREKDQSSIPILLKRRYAHL